MKTEKSLIQLAQQGQTEAFSILVESHKNRTYALAYRMVSNAQDAEEVTQDAFIKAYQSIKQFRGKSKFSTWLYRITYFTAINHLRKKKMVSANIDMSTFSDDDASALETLGEDDRNKYIQEALEYLTPVERNLITLYYWEDCSVKEIHEITSLSLSNIKIMLMRTRKKLYGILKTLLNDELESILIHRR